MARIRVGGKTFRQRYTLRSKALLASGRSLPDRPTPEQIHDLRVAARRLQVMRGLLPRSVRSSQAFRDFGVALRSILKSTSQLRDLDTLTDTLELQKKRLPDELFVNLSNQRSDAAARAKAASELFADIPPPLFDPSVVRGKSVTRRLRKRIKRRGRVITGLLAEVLQDEAKVEELHALRKAAKKMRYLLELVDETPAELSVLTKWQESLGAIHDLDVAMAYLASSNLDFAKDRAIREFRRLRHTKYLRFASEYRSDSIQTLEGSRVLAGGPTAFSA